MSRVLKKINFERIVCLFLGVSLIVVALRKDCNFSTKLLGYARLDALQGQIGLARVCFIDIQARLDEKVRGEVVEMFENFNATMLYYSFWEIMNMDDLLRVEIFETLNDDLKEDMLWALTLMEKRNHGYVSEKFRFKAIELKKEIELAQYDEEKARHFEKMYNRIYHQENPGGDISRRK